jgi:hypothetical protein
MDDCRTLARGFVAAGGAMRLAPVKVGAGATMCVRSSAGPGASVPAGACVGPCSSALVGLYKLNPVDP